MLYIRPYKNASASAKLLCQALQITNLKKRTKLRSGDVILNWGGQGDMPDDFDYDTMYMINSPEAITRAVFKVDTLQAIAQYTGNTNYFTTRSDVMQWIANQGGMPAGMVIYCRTLTRASKGRGIVVAKSVDEIVDAPLYTYAYPCKREYRVHVFGSSIVDLVAKVKVVDKNSPKYVENPNAFVRNSETGYVFARGAVKIPNSVREELENSAKTAVDALGLTFGAVDIVRDVNNNYTVLEINTAPGIMGSALAGYVDAINYQVRVRLGNIVERDEVYEDQLDIVEEDTSTEDTVRPGYQRPQYRPTPPRPRRSRSRSVGVDAGNPTATGSAFAHMAHEAAVARSNQG